MVCADYECEEGKEENWKAYAGEAENFVSYDIQERKQNAGEESSNYKVRLPMNGKIIYANGNFLTISEEPLEDGLLGYTDTKTKIAVTTENKYEHTTDDILVHEKLHVFYPDWSEYTLRIVTDHNDNVDIGLEQRETAKRNDSVAKSYYNV